MKDFLAKARELIWMKAKFALTGSVATVVDMTLFYFLEKYATTAVIANVISYSCGMVINFILQRRFIFDLQRKVSTAFLGSLLVSIGGLALSTLIIYILNQYAFFQELPIAAKIIATGTVFFYNFYLKRYVFEKKFV
ncbi:MAG: GtrA family protein [Saprospiraceae bacterium]